MRESISTFCISSSALPRLSSATADFGFVFGPGRAFLGFFLHTWSASLPFCACLSMKSASCAWRSNSTRMSPCFTLEPAGRMFVMVRVPSFSPARSGAWIERMGRLGRTL